MVKKIQINNEVRDMTAEEESFFDETIAEIQQDISQEKLIEILKPVYNNKQETNEMQNKKTKQASGKQKLKDLGLDDDEINALMGV